MALQLKAPAARPGCLLTAERMPAAAAGVQVPQPKTAEVKRSTRARPGWDPLAAVSVASPVWIGSRVPPFGHPSPPQHGTRPGQRARAGGVREARGGPGRPRGEAPTQSGTGCIRIAGPRAGRNTRALRLDWLERLGKTGPSPVAGGRGAEPEQTQRFYDANA